MTAAQCVLQMFLCVLDNYHSAECSMIDKKLRIFSRIYYERTGQII